MLTQRQQEIYDFVVSYVRQHGYPPTVREIGEAVGLASPSTVHVHLANLEQAGYLRRDPTKPRALELVGRERTRGCVARPDAGEVRVLPLVGEIAAGGPLLAEQNVEDYLAVPDTLSRGGDEFLLRVKGESMIEAGILDGRLRRRPAAADGARTATSSSRSPARTRPRRGDREDLLPREGPHPPAARELRDGAALPRARQILGKVVGLFRRVG